MGRKFEIAADRLFVSGLLRGFLQSAVYEHSAQYNCCSEIFDDELKHYVGLTVWEIEHFLPNLLEDCLHGNFYEGDCYIVLSVCPILLLMD